MKHSPACSKFNFVQSDTLFYVSWSNNCDVYCVASHKGATSASPEEIAPGQTGPMGVIDIGNSRDLTNMSMWIISRIFGLRTSRNPQNRQFRHYRWVWVRPLSVTSDDLRKVKTQCHGSDVVIFWPKSRIMPPFQSRATSYVPENAISVKNRWDVVPFMKSLLHALTDQAIFFFYKICTRHAP